MTFDEIRLNAWKEEDGAGELDLRKCVFDDDAEERQANEGKAREISGYIARAFEEMTGTKAEKADAFRAAFLMDGSQLRALLDNFSLSAYQRRLIDDICRIVAEHCRGKIQLRDIRAAYKGYMAARADAGQLQTVQLSCMAAPLNCPGWLVTRKKGCVKVSADKERGTERRQVLLPVPMAIIKKYANVESGLLSYEVAAELPQGDGQRVSKGIFPASVLLAKSQVISLTDALGVAFSSNTAGLAVDYFQTLINANLESMPEGRTISRLGWVGEGEFFPYTAGGLQVDDSGVNRAVYEGFTRTAGEKEICLEGLAQLRQGLGFRLMMSAALAAPLVALVGLSSFVVEVVGRTEKGKSQGLLAVASVFGCAEEGSPFSIVQSANGTENSFAARLKFQFNLPLFIDETQLLDYRLQPKLPYIIAQGIDRGRANIYGGARESARWQTVALLTGEKSLSGGAAQNGAENRLVTIDIDETELYSGLSGADAGQLVHEKIIPNYGHLGREYISLLDKTEVVERWKAIKEEIRGAGKDYTEKQAAVVALMVAADDFWREHFAPGETLLDALEVAAILCKTKDEISMGVKAWEFINDFVTARRASFFTGNLIHDETLKYGLGKITEDAVYIFKSELDAALQNSALQIGFDYVKKEWVEKGWLVRDKKGKYTFSTTINGHHMRAVRLAMTVKQDIIAHADE